MMKTVFRQKKNTTMNVNLPISTNVSPWKHRLVMTSLNLKKDLFSATDRIKYITKHNIKRVWKKYCQDTQYWENPKKNGNLYYHIVAHYHKAICKEVNKVYKKTPGEWREHDINKEAWIIAAKLKIDDICIGFTSKILLLTLSIIRIISPQNPVPIA